MILLTSHYGPLADVVTGATSAVAAAGAIGLTWRGRARWEPADSDLPKGPERVGGLVGAVAIVVLWYEFHRSESVGPIVGIAIGAAVVAVVALLVYVYLIALQMYVKLTPVTRTKVREEKVIGGLWLTSEARDAMRSERVPVQDVFKGMGYDPDKVWPRAGRGLAKVAFIASYLCLTVGGTVALAASGLLLAVSGSVTS